MSEISTRLMAGRYGELRYLRTLSVVEKRTAGLEELMRTHAHSRRSAMEQSTPDDEETSADASSATEAEDTGVNHELRELSNSHRVSGIASAFRQRLEQTVGWPRQRPRSAPSAQPGRRTTAEREPTGVVIQAAPRRTVHGGLPARIDNERTRADIAALNSAGRVAALLGDHSLRQRIERVLQARVNDPNGATQRALHDRAAIERRIVSEPPRPPLSQPSPGTAVPAQPGGAATLDRLDLVANASFELLLSIQRTLQQDLGAALQEASAARRRTDPSEDDEDGEGSIEGIASPMVARTASDEVRPFTSPSAGEGFRGLGACVVCTDSEVNTVFYRCGHMATCARCAHALRRRRANCPICRAPVRDVIQVFLACAPSRHHTQ